MRILTWHALTADARTAALARPVLHSRREASKAARDICVAVRERGDSALREYTAQFDGAALETCEVSEREFSDAERALDQTQRAAIDLAIRNVTVFHRAQRSSTVRVEVMPGVVCEHRSVPLGSVGLYVPAGTAPLPSTAIMLAVPAAIAECSQTILCTPPARDGRANSAILFAARRAGVQRVFKAGGAQAIAAMAYGTQSIPKCDKIFGPGNAWVTAAKMHVASDPEGAALDMPAGPSEVMVVADEQASAEFIAADLLAQAEHSVDAQALLLTTSRAMTDEVAREIGTQVKQLSRQAILAQALESMRLIIVETLGNAFEIVNRYAPEHLILQVKNPRRWADQVLHAGAVFLGPWSPESAGDYCSGTNHTLPTYGFARAYSALSVHDFQRRMSIQELSGQGLESLGATTCTLAALEGLDAHAAAVTRRLRALRLQVPA